MSKARVHKVVLHPDGTNHFQKVLDHQGQPLDVNAAARATNPNWAPYTDLCVDAYQIDSQGDVQDGLPAMLILRTNFNCSCGGYCGHPEDHTLTPLQAMARVTPIAKPVAAPLQTKHGTGNDYREGHLTRGDLRGILSAAVRAAGGTITGPDPTTHTDTTQTYAYDAAACADLGKWATAEAAKFDLSAPELQGLLADHLSADDAVRQALAGTCKNSQDVFWTLAALHLWRQMLGAVHQTLSQSWPSRPPTTISRLGTRTVSIQTTAQTTTPTPAAASAGGDTK